MNKADLDWRDNVPVSSTFDDVYYSVDDGLEETRFVFLQNNQIPQRFSEHKSPVFTVLETGFGTGLNFFATLQTWLANKPDCKKLQFVSIEKYPLYTSEIQQAIAHWPELSELCEALCKQLPPPVSGWHKLTLFNGDVELLLIYDDVLEALKSIQQTDIYADAIFLDGFAPAKNPDMWRNEVLTALGKCTANNATLATFTAVGHVRRGLIEAGFDMRKAPGFGRKREMLVGTKNIAEERPAQWYKHKTNPVKRVAVIGAGIAGSHISAQLAQSGIDVTVFDKANSIAAGASGNPQGVVFVKLSAGGGDLAEFSLHSYLHAIRCYTQLEENGADSHGENCGMLHLCDDKLWTDLKTKFGHCKDHFIFVNATEASDIAGQTVASPCIYFPQGQWLAPKQLCKDLLDQPNISVVTDCTINGLERHNDSWRLRSTLAAQETFDTVVFANAFDASRLSDQYRLPIRPASGQISHVKHSVEIAPKTIVCGKGYVVPAKNGEFTFGASYRMNSETTQVLQEDHIHNVELIQSALPEFKGVDNLEGRTSTRAATNDYLPFVGPMPDIEAFQDTFSELQHNAKAKVNLHGPSVEGLYLFCGFGSRGLSYTPFCAELLRDQILGNGIQHHAKWTEITDPARFIVRGLKRNTIDELMA